MFFAQNNKNIIKKYKPYLGIFLYIFILTATFFAGDFFYRVTKSQQTIIDDKKVLIAQKNQTITDISEIMESTPDFPQKVEVLDGLVFQKGGVGASQFLAQMDLISKKSKVKISSINPSVTENSVSADLTIIGKWNNIENFIKNIEKNMLIINVNSIKIISDSSDSASLIISLGAGS